MKDDRVQNAAQLAQFKSMVVAHLDAAYNLARWLTRDDHGAEDCVQDACVRAFRAFDQLHGPNPKAWFMAIVRNVTLDWLRTNKQRQAEDTYDDETHGNIAATDSPERTAVQASQVRWVHECIASLPREYREVIVLRELEELSYKEISAIVDIPIGTVMSRLARGRDLLQKRLNTAPQRMQS
jgi:RNA polymerase sigma factor (sigma-70 family)